MILIIRSMPAPRPALTLPAILVIALLPLLALVLPAAAPPGAPQQLIVLLPKGGNDLAQVARYLDAADAKPLGQGRWSALWLVSSTDSDAAGRLYAAGARLVLSGNHILAGCLGFRTQSQSQS